jgi:hypothetical protein
MNCVRAQRELAVGGAFEEAAGGREVLGRQFGGCGPRDGVGEGEEDHHRVEAAVGARIGGVPGVEAHGVVGVGPLQGTGR